ncbi:uncharacterized protein [Diadema antillarum]|uniref:uncharacterized protein n=1 Tax=Diadema antillarum TaxID=105358 RepID=UPI003A88B711
METSIDLDLDDLMEPLDDLEEDLPTITALPALDDDDENDPLNSSAQQNNGLLDTLLDPGGQADGEAPARKTVNRKPIPKLDAARLTSDRGLPVLLKHFEKVKFKGKGHEVEDLDKLMRVMEHWAHRLFPKMPFDDVIERVEKLGSKKPVQTCLKKIRLDMPLMDEDFITRGDEANDGTEGGREDMAADEADDIFPASNLGAAQQPPDDVSIPRVDLTEDQKERIKRNKQLAQERRQAKQQGDAPSSQGKSSQSNGVSSAELEDVITMDTGGSKKASWEEDDIDPDEAEMEAEIWTQMVSESQVTGSNDLQRSKSTCTSQTSQRQTVTHDVEPDSDDAEMENEIWSQMGVTGQNAGPEKVDKGVNGTLLLQAEKKQEEIINLDPDVDDEESQGGKGAKASNKPHEEKDDADVVSDDDEDDVDADIIDAETEPWDKMIEPVDEQPSKDSQGDGSCTTGQATKKKRRGVIEDDDDDDEEEADTEVDDAQIGTEIWNQMTEPVPSQSIPISQHEESPIKMSSVRKRSKKILDDEDEDD